jgi:hypothetical protein
MEGGEMEKLEGQRKKLYIHYVKEDLKNYAGVADESARKTEQYTTALALEAEDLNRNADRMDLSLDKISTEYETRQNDAGDKLLIKVDPCEAGAFLSLAVGCQRVPLSEDVMRQLKIYEAMKPSMMRMYDEVENIDGVFLFDTKSNIFTFRTEYMFADDFFNLAGMDLKSIYDAGMIFYDWFRFIDQKNNPARRARWSDIAFIAIEHDWITHLKAPMYKNRYSENEEMIGMVSVHYNLDWLYTNTIATSAVKMMIVKDDSTLIGLNDSAKQDIPLETFNKNNWSAFNPFDPATTQQKKKFVYETLNLDHGKSEDVTSFSVKLKSEFQFNHTLFGKNYTVLRERAPEMGMNFVALLENV